MGKLAEKYASQTVPHAIPVRYIPPKEYESMGEDFEVSANMAQMELLDMDIRVYAVEGGATIESLGGEIQNVGKTKVAQTLSKEFGLSDKHRHVVIHDKDRLGGFNNYQPGDNVHISYSNGVGKVTPCFPGARYIYEIDSQDALPEEQVEKIAQFISTASAGGKIRLSSDKIAEVVGNAIQNIHHTQMRDYGMAIRKDQVLVSTTDMVESAPVTRAVLLKAYEHGYRPDKTETNKAREEILRFVAETDRSEFSSEQQMAHALNAVNQP